MWIGVITLFFGQMLGSGILTVLVKIGLNEFSPLLLSSIRFLVAALCLYLLFVKRNKLTFFDKSLINTYKQSIFFTGNIIFFSIGLQFTTAIISQILYLSVPIIVAILAHFFLDEKITKTKIVGFLIVFAGLFLLFQQSFSGQHVAFGTPLGNGLILIACTMWSLYVVTSRKAAKKESTIKTTFANAFFTSLAVTILIPLPIGAHGIIHNATLLGFYSVVLLGIGTVAQYVAMQYGIKHTSATTVSFMQYMGPVFAAIFAIPILHERVNTHLIVASLLILLGVFVVTTYPLLKKRPITVQ